MVSHAAGATASPSPLAAGISIQIPSAIVEAIDELVGAEYRGAFVRAAVEDRLRRLQRVRSFVGHLSAVDVPEWATEESTAAWLREIRDWPDHWVEADAEADR